MTQQLDCPACHQKLHFPGFSDSYGYLLEGVCTKCRFLTGLGTGYGHICNMLTIDYETSRLARQLPDDATAKILSQLEELKTLEAQK
jgi:hypothetical protein